MRSMRGETIKECPAHSMIGVWWGDMEGGGDFFIEQISDPANCITELFNCKSRCPDVIATMGNHQHILIYMH